MIKKFGLAIASLLLGLTAPLVKAQTVVDGVTVLNEFEYDAYI